MKYIIPLILAFSLVVFLMPIMIKIANKYNFTDKPTKRKIHRGDIPLIGGFTMYIGFFITFFITLDNYNVNKKVGIFVGGTLIVIIGLIDDYFKSVGKEFRILPRLIVQIIASIIVFSSGIYFKGFSNPFTGIYVRLPIILQFLLTVTWIFGVTTVINWTDGMDGLAGGLSLVSAITFGISAIILSQNESLILSLIIMGCLIGFLIYNKCPAKVFMGDSGANLLGFILSTIALDGAFKQATVFSLVIPILALAVPIFDNLFVIFKRFSEGKPVYQADRSQIHYRLQEKGLSAEQTVMAIMLISIIFSMLSIIVLLLKY